MIELKQVSKSYDVIEAVKEIDLVIQNQNVFGMLGTNGAGKSTTIDIILGLKKQDSGKAMIFGMEAAKNRKAVFERTGVQLQDSHYQAAIRVEELCQEHAALYENPRDYRELLEQFGLSDFKKSQVVKLSGGERQRLSVILALLGNPEVVFLDELTTGLDVAARREIWTTLKRMKEEGLTIFLTTHYMEEAEFLCDEIMLIKDGKEVIRGSVSEVVEASPCDNLEEAYLWYMGQEVER